MNVATSGLHLCLPSTSRDASSGSGSRVGVMKFINKSFSNPQCCSEGLKKAALCSRCLTQGRSLPSISHEMETRKLKW
ncbi:hypothetical protein E2C01_042767 [Portunus trituberculatus]|uniref:Uncharacterized protein n=1 Tax=Portunus trituberculatus TaxID=210409 RepID=A0A5B7FMM7_PORTR|nr:hypothetical protein [Portunus trituberculatus]